MYRTMKARYIIAALLLMVAGLQTAKAQKIILYYGGKEPIEVNVARLDSITFVEAPITDGHEWVDLGLPSGTLWARTNIGADTAEDYGDYFAWGETATKENYSWDTYAYMQGGWTGRLTKYCTLEDEGTVDNLTVLEAADDAAMTLWSHNWQMPSKAQFEELLDESNTRAEWTTTSSGINGLLVTSKRNGESIFLPAASGYYGWFVDYIGTTGLYWSRMLRTDYPEDAYCLLFDNSGQINTESSASRLQGLSIRPVRYKKVQLVTDITLNKTVVSLQMGTTAQLTATVLPASADNTKVTWESSDEAVATVSSEGLVTAVYVGTCTVTCRATDGSGVKAECQVIVEDGKVYVDLGLPSGTLWAEMNVGADSPGGSGDFFAWGETSPNGYFNEAYYKYYYNGGSYPQKYNGVDNLTELEAEDDAATVNWSTNWQTPSTQQLRELFDEEYVTAEWTWQDGSYGYLITSKANGNSIFLPKAGYMTWDNINHCPKNLGDGYYWSRNLSKTNCSKARYLYFNGNNLNTIDKDYGRFFGLPVRPVLNEHSDYKWPVKSITLNETELSLYLIANWPHENMKQLTATVRPYYALNRDVVWESSDEAVATVSSDGLVTAVDAGTCTITCHAADGSGVKAECKVTVVDHEYVDLGLPSGTLWATCNVGANYPFKAGDYFAWGETEPKEDYSRSTYKWCKGDGNTMTKYCWQSDYGYNGFTDDKVELEPEDDAATANWGSDWQMPSLAQFEELINDSYTTTTWTTTNGVYGCKITSKSNGKSIFLPAAGDRVDTDLLMVGSDVFCWSRSLYMDHSNGARGLYLTDNTDIGYSHCDADARERGRPVRPVRKQSLKVHEYVDLYLPSGTLWATCNVGAASPEDYGDYFAWGETESKEDYSWSTYKWCNGTSNTLTKYCSDSSKGYNGFTDDKVELEPEDDAATANWGSGWQMPSWNQCEELIHSSYTTTEWTTQNGVYGLRITSKANGNTIFLPAAGYWNVTLHGYVGSNGHYWSRLLDKSDSNSAYSLYFGSDNVDTDRSYGRYYGFSVRPVRKEALKVHEYVDLCLPSGTLWATCNVGAASPEDYGDYFAWGETTTKEEYSWSTYKYCEGSDITLTKYCYENYHGYNGFKDTLTELEPEDDAATVNWGRGWQMPSSEQLEELISSSYTTTEWTTQNGVYGRKITSKSNGKSIFLPAAGYYNGTRLGFVGSEGNYWSRSLYMRNTGYADYLLCGSSIYGLNGSGRYYGQSVRPVRQK